MAEISSTVYQLSAIQPFQCSSASRKFLNASRQWPMPGRPQTFQCSSASRKFLNRSRRGFQGTTCRRFSALQRAENSSIGVGDVDDFRQQLFQCSSASRKFLNGFVMCSSSWFSIAFQCSSASRKFLNRFVPVPGLRPLLFQ